MKIREPKKMICNSCNKELKNANEGFGIPVFKGFYFQREWICIECIKNKVKKEIERRTK